MGYLILSDKVIGGRETFLHDRNSRKTRKPLQRHCDGCQPGIAITVMIDMTWTTPGPLNFRRRGELGIAPQMAIRTLWELREAPQASPTQDPPWQPCLRKDAYSPMRKGSALSLRSASLQEPASSDNTRSRGPVLRGFSVL
jgi:hypothetical protein